MHRIIECICFCFSTYKNRNVRAVVLVVGMSEIVSSWLYIFSFTFLFVKIKKVIGIPTNYDAMAAVTTKVAFFIYLDCFSLFCF